jgi:heptosyltransferase-1
MGDVVRTLPSLAAIRSAYPEARITWLVERTAAGVLEGCRDLDEVILFPRESLSARLRAGRLIALWRELRAFVVSLRSERFDLVLDFHSILKSGVISLLSGSPLRVAYAPPFGRELGWLGANRRAALEPDRASRYERNAGLVRYLGIEFPEREEHAIGSPAFTDLLTVETSAAARMDDCLGRERPRVLIHPGSSAGASYKRYKPEGFAALARMLGRLTGSRTLVIRGTSPDELALAERIVEGARGAAHLAPETPELADLIALIDRAQLFIGSDSGPLHLAATLGTPVVQILGPTDPVENRPWAATPSRQVRIPVACSPCRSGCRAATCMQIIPHETLYGAALELLDPSPDRDAKPAPMHSLRPVAPASASCP